MNAWLSLPATFKVGGAIYLASALAFLSQLIGEITGFHLFKGSWLAHELISIVTFVGFVTGVLLIWRSHHLLLHLKQEIEHHLRAAQGEFFAMLNVQFDQWGLSKAEWDIALLTVKGLSVAEIADLRNTSKGTVKSQNSSILRKAGVKIRTQLLGGITLRDEFLIKI
ncbi:MAG: DNA-binding CsgD family transcriptional regulator [Paracoccaceae bacterium]